MHDQLIFLKQYLSEDVIAMINTSVLIDKTSDDIKQTINTDPWRKESILEFTDNNIGTSS